MKHFAVMAALIVVVSCTGNHHGADGHWSYEGRNGPEHWGDLDPAWEVAQSGREQSPIDLNGATPAARDKLTFHYGSFPLDMVNNGHTIQINAFGNHWMMKGKERYRLLQFHFHTPSEHTINGKHSPMEVHLVHANDRGELAVVGVMLDKGKAHPLLAKFWKHMPREAKGSYRDPEIMVSPAALLPANRASFRYDGSLTTPPCTEGVSWIVMATSTEASAEQIEAFHSLFGDTNRPVQPLHERKIYLAH